MKENTKHGGKINSQDEPDQLVAVAQRIKWMSVGPLEGCNTATVDRGGVLLHLFLLDDLNSHSWEVASVELEYQAQGPWMVCLDFGQGHSTMTCFPVLSLQGMFLQSPSRPPGGLCATPSLSQAIRPSTCLSPAASRSPLVLHTAVESWPCLLVCRACPGWTHPAALISWLYRCLSKVWILVKPFVGERERTVP